MKKTYSKPVISTVKVETAGMIAASVDMYGTNATRDAMGKERGTRSDNADFDDLW